MEGVVELRAKYLLVWTTGMSRISQLVDLITQYQDQAFKKGELVKKSTYVLSITRGNVAEKLPKNGCLAGHYIMSHLHWYRDEDEENDDSDVPNELSGYAQLDRELFEIYNWDSELDIIQRGRLCNPSHTR